MTASAAKALKLVTSVASAVVAAALVGGVRTLPESRGGQDVVGTELPDLEFDRRIQTEADKASAEAPAARVTLYRWWTGGCAFCETSLPAVEALRTKYGDKGLRTVAVYHPKPPREVDDDTIRAAATRLGYHGGIAVDLDWSELKRFYLSKGQRRATSASFLVDAHGVIRFAHPGPDFFPSDDPKEARQNQDYRLIEQAIEQLLTEKPRSGERK